MNQESTLEQKREKAADYLRSRNIHRADVRCGHKYDRCPHIQPPPRFDVSRSGIAQGEPNEY